MGVPKMDGLQGENPIKMDDLRVPLFQETFIYIHIYINPFHESLEISQALLLAASHVTHCFTSSLVA